MGLSYPNWARSCARTAGVMRGESYANGSPGTARTTKNVIVVTMKTTMIDCPSRAARRRRTLSARRLQADAIAIDALVGWNGPLGEAPPPAVGADRRDVDASAHGVDPDEVVEPDRGHVVDDLL